MTGHVAFTGKVTKCAQQEMFVEKLGVKRHGCKYNDLLTYLLTCLLTQLLACLLAYLLA
jgi:hypothetical protein